MSSLANNRNGGMLITRNERSMPKWVTEQSDRIGPRPPPPPLTPENGHAPAKQPSLPPKTKSQPEPDYEVIEFSNQQYSNAPLRPNSASSGSKTPDNKLKCTLCGSGNPWVTCEECAQQIFCASCDDMFHKHPKRKDHQRKTIEKSRPPIPPKTLPGQPGPTPPVAPPRRNKRGLMTPIMQRKDQGNAMPGPFPVPPSPTPSMKNASWQERFGSLPRGLNLLNRPLPETPKTPSESSRSTTPKSVFDNIQRPPSVALEKIKSKANATLDRMQLLQQRYRQQKEQMERERSGSVTDQNMSAFDQWSSISQSPSHFRSGSMSSGINSSHLDLMDDNNFNLFHQRQMALQHHHMAAQRANQLGQRGMSSSVFNLNQINRKQNVTTNGWMNNPMQQAQSMAQLNCANCAQQQSQWNGTNQHHMHIHQDPWSNQLSSQQHLNRSNMSLNVPAGYMMQPQMNGMYPPPTFMNQRGFQQMYPQPYMGGMPVMNPGLMGMPPSTSRAASRAGSRMASPAMSRKSVTLRRKQRSSYIDDEATDDEDSDEDDRRSITSARSGVSRTRQRRMSSASQFPLDDDIELSQSKSHRNRRNQRRDSIAKSVHNDWAPGRGTSSSNNNNNNRSADSGFNSPLKPSRIYSDLDSEGSGTRALVQAKIEQKLKEENLKQKSSKPKRQSQSPTPQKTSAAVQTPAVKQTIKQEIIEKVVDTPVKQEREPSPSESEEEQQHNKKDEQPLEVEVKQESASEEEETESEESEESEEAEQEQEAEQIEVNEIEEDDLGPPPSTPDHEWECEFCTFVNEANIKICSICCKTPSIKPKKAIKSISPPKQIKSPLVKKEKGHAKEKEHEKETVKDNKDKSGTIKKKPSASTLSSTIQHTATNNTETTKITNNIQTTNTDSAHTTDDANKFTLKTKESVEDIWATLDENIQATAHEVTRKAESKKSSKVSTACGTSSKSASVERQENDSRQSQAREIGTSPPPQSISTQTYDTLPIQKPETREEPIAKPTPQPLYNDMIQQTNFPPSPKIQDMKSFEAEVLNKIHNISHVPAHHHYQNNHHHANHPMYSYNERQRYRSNNDLRMDDAMSMDFETFNGLGRRQPSISELMLLQKTSSQMHSPLGGSIYDLPYRDLSSLRLNDMENHKESDLYKHTTEELNAALKYCGPDMHPLVWLRDNWPKLIQTVQSLATKYGQERAENTIGTISQMEARDALRMHTGNIWQAVSECIEQRQRKYRDISSKGNFSREDIVTALTTHQGNVELALLDLSRTQLKPFLMRIWGSPAGVENESGSLPLPVSLHSSTQSTHYNMDKDIHNFLSANASECMQTPNATGAFHNNNQMPSPFDRPASLNSPFENNNHMLDNTSSYSADSKDFANSPLPIDETILSNKNVLKDLETLIGNMEHNQQNQNEQVLRSIHDMITNGNPKTDNEYDSETMRILTKSPITSTKFKSTPKDNNSENEADVKNFVWQHIQEIVPNLVQQVEMELMEDIDEKLKNNEEDEEKAEITEITPETLQVAPAPPPPPPIDQDEFLMEEVIKPNIKTASIREELPPQYVYTAEIATFQLAFDKGLEREHEEEFDFDTLEEASRLVFKMFKAPDTQITQTSEEVGQTQAQDHKTHNGDLHETQVQKPIPTLAQSVTIHNYIPPIEENNLEYKVQELSSGTQNDIPKSSENGSILKTQIPASPVTDPELIKITNAVNVEETLVQNPTKLDSLPNTNKAPTTLQMDTNKETIVQVIASSEIESEVLSETVNQNTSENLIVEQPQAPATDTSVKTDEIPTTSQNVNLHETNISTDVPTNDSATTNDGFPNQTHEQLSSFADIENPIATQTIEPTAKEDNIDNYNTSPIDINQPAASLSSSAGNKIHISETASTSDSTKPIEDSAVVMKTKEKQENPTTSSQRGKSNKPSKIRTKTINQYKRTTLKDLSKELEQTEIAMSQVEKTQSSDMPETIENSANTTEQVPEVVVKKDHSTTDHIEPSEENISRSNPVALEQLGDNDGNISKASSTTIDVAPVIETKTSTNEALASSSNKRVSKIPVRRTASNKSLINTSSTILRKTDSNENVKTNKQNVPTTAPSQVVESPQPPSDLNSSHNLTNNETTEDESEEEELYSIESDTSATEVASRADQFQSPSTTSEMFLVIQQETTDNNSTIAPSTSSSTLHSTISQSSGLKSPTEFIPSGDPSKQNLSELVEDTQRLIKQMKDEISIDDFESSTDDEEYTDEYSDEYDDEEEGEEEEDEDWEEGEEEEEEDETGDEEEYDDITEDITEGNEVFSNEDESISKTQSPLPSQESQDHRDIHNSSALSNITESSDHSQTFLTDHLEQDEAITETKTNDTQNQINSNEETGVFVETENSLPELPVETVIDNNLEQSQTSMQYVESENVLPEMSVETVLQNVNSLSSNDNALNTQQHSYTQHDSEDKSALVSGLRDILSASTTIANELETENSLPELPAEVIVANARNAETLQDHVKIPQNEKEQPTSSNNQLPTDKNNLRDSTKETQIENQSAKTSDDLPLTMNKQATETEPLLSNQEVNLTTEINIEDQSMTTSEGLTSTVNKQQTETQNLSSKHVADKANSANSKIDMPSTSHANKTSSTSLEKPNSQNTVSETHNDNMPSTSKGIKSSETKKKLNEEVKTSVKKPLAASKIPKPKEMPKEPKTKETTTAKPQNEFKKKLYTRSKSFSGPTTPIGIASVKTISQKFISPTLNTTPTPTQKVYPTVTRKSSIVEAINKLTRPSPSSTEKPAVSSLFKSRTQPRIPKKKYHETCFSDDDYESSTEEEELEPLEIRQRKLSVPVFRAYPSVQEQVQEEVNTEELVEKFMKEELAATIAEAQIAAVLVSMKFQQDVSLWAAKECSDLDHAIALLKQECELCSGTYALNQIVSMLKCTHKCCKQCAKTYFTVQITERSINDCSCPFCKLPELHNQTEHEDENLEYFSNLDIFLKNILEPEVHELFQRKLRDRTLLKDPNFKWCVQCSSGFFARPKQKRLICPDCGSVTCAQCRKTWQKQHEGISCDQYSEWESANDPEVQAKGVQQHLEQNGIDCPKCKFRYSLARGGCMHFTCTQCKYEFCYGCAKPFMMGAKCNISPYCAKLGLHAHHPRNCLFYLRDKLPIQLQILLKNNGVPFEVDPIETSENNVDDNEPSSSKKKELLCPIPIQKETPTGLVDTRCNGDVPEKHAGMCRTHYVEYLTAKVAKAKIDPLPIFDLTDCVQELRRRGIALPERGPWDTDEIYKTMCAEVIQKNIPLDMA
ncbi:E3 ubiquitin-protein ligase lubel isoform X1 [Lucilia cuprina]|uniref:E3 ubiquitin-protein ligase lubel isoform X1 n=1 Tax=Lucilia cuprina TaxID=7375 RepID=UPI001F051C01|nr:E3 ubiquitin-protein ligase lubel isoform X1 [Lucilia cuprina]XP_046801218.1 E3 ubiquitin-protein ligase lubel isoform X1 [Lucilia cuprina]XP_046801219.1 E3 ubiquitin-protein ligase lubel isoform X1 [Lucilia cuprina]XP_046801221.1 E3 ubiquitin-protein ligase lubel isoform X1 [Lucilia cuprina]